jgi:chromosome partitioning protein
MPIQVVVVAASKGGVGKSTLATNLAVLVAAERKKVALLDIDPMQSMTRWYQLRQETERKSDNLVLLPVSDDVRERVEYADKRGFDVLVIDTPPAFSNTISRAVRAAARGGIVIAPCQPSPFDLEGMQGLIRIVGENGSDLLFVINRVRGKSMVTGTREILATAGQVAAQEIADRVIYAAAAIDGGAGVEGSAEANREMTALWKEVKAALRRAKA